jgi:anaerobic selenocysteine-containing dehydrogenase
MTETAVLSHYILPSRSAYESWDASFFSWNWPEVYFKMRRPVVDPEGEPLEMSQFWVRLADQMGFIPPIPDSLYEAAKGSRKDYAKELLGYLSQNPEAAKVAPFVIAKTLGEAMGSANLASLWGILLNTPKRLREDAVRAGFTDGPWLGDDLFQALLDHPEGLWIGKSNPDNMTMLRTENGLIQLGAPEMEEWIKSIEPQVEEQALKQSSEYPFILLAGRHMPMNANNMMRNPEWNHGKRACTLAMNPADAEKLGMTDGQMVQVKTEAGIEKIELEITTEARVGQVIIPHGFGLEYDGQVYGINVNRLCKNTHRDKFAATPLHRYVPCKVEFARE